MVLRILKLNKKKTYFYKNLSKPISFAIFLISLISIKSEFLNAENLPDKLQIDPSTKTEEDSSLLPTNPFEIVEMIRKYNSLNDATSPSDAIDDALKSFDNLEKK